MNMRLPIFLACTALGATVFALCTFCHSESPTTALAAMAEPERDGATAAYVPTYSKEGNLTPPLQYREWVYLTSGLDMSYLPKASADMSMFDNVFVNPQAYRSFKDHGTWPDKTVLVLESRGAANKGSINKSGHFQSGGIMGLEVHIKDEARFPGKWAFFDVESETKATLIPQGAPCYTCHQDHAAVDTTFVQFYPTLLPIAREKNMLSAKFLSEIEADSGKGTTK